MEQLCPMPPATVNPGRSHPDGAGQPVAATGRHMKEYCHGDESQDDEDSGQEGWRKEETGQGHESLELEHEEVAGQESRREKS